VQLYFAGYGTGGGAGSSGGGAPQYIFFAGALPRACICQITGNSGDPGSGGSSAGSVTYATGVYSAQMFAAPTSFIDPTATLASSVFGTLPASNDTIVFNAPEIGNTGSPWLTYGGQQPIVEGVWFGCDPDGTKLVMTRSFLFTQRCAVNSGSGSGSGGS
jgi:hypothetical protein